MRGAREASDVYQPSPAGAMADCTRNNSLLRQDSGFRVQGYASQCKIQNRREKTVKFNQEPKEPNLDYYKSQAASWNSGCG